MSRQALTADQRAALDARQRSQILGALAACIGRSGYASATIADIARAAKVSKSTVYAHFGDKEEIFLALYSTSSDYLIAMVDRAGAATRGQPWRQRVRTVLGAYLEAMAAGEDLTRCMLVEAQAVSPRALALRVEVIERYVESLMRLAREVAAENPPLCVPDQILVRGVLGGINEYMLSAIAAGRAPRLHAVTNAATELMCTTLIGAATIADY